MATITFSVSSVPLTGSKVYTSTDADVGLLLQWGSTVYQSLITAGPPTCSFTGSISGTTLTVTAVPTGALALYQTIFSPVGGASIAPGTYISAMGTGSGGTGTYTVSMSQTAASGPLTSYSSAAVGVGIFEGTINAWTEAQQKFAKDNNIAAVPTPPPMGWA
jgi:hypothetical protein